jgi:hypothetical protein
LHLLRLGLRRKYYIKLMKKKKGNSELETHHRKDREANFRVDSGTELLGKRVLSGDWEMVWALVFGSRFWLAFTGRCVLGDTLPDPKISYPLEFIQHLESHNVFPLFSIFLIYLFIYLFIWRHTLTWVLMMSLFYIEIT